MSGTAKATHCKFGRYIQGSIRTPPVKNFGENGAWVYQEMAQIFEVPPIISGMGKGTNIKFGRYIQSVHANKNRLKMWENSERGHIQGLSKFFWVPLRTSTFVRTFLVSIGTKVYYKFLEKYSRVRSEDSQKFSGHAYIGCIARSSLW